MKDIAKISRARAWAKSAGMEKFMTATYADCIAYLGATKKIKEFYKAFPGYDPNK